MNRIHAFWLLAALGCSSGPESPAPELPPIQTDAGELPCGDAGAPEAAPTPVPAPIVCVSEQAEAADLHVCPQGQELFMCNHGATNAVAGSVCPAGWDMKAAWPQWSEAWCCKQ